jgi:hypothetical protein
MAIYERALNTAKPIGSGRTLPHVDSIVMLPRALDSWPMRSTSFRPARSEDEKGSADLALEHLPRMAVRVYHHPTVPAPGE